MRDSNEVAELIIKRLVQTGEARSIKKKYKFIELIPGGVRILRETGVLWDIKKDYIIIAVDAMRMERAVYDTSPVRLRLL